ncbi:MAG TPA: TonB-dependent receptor [Candidatus Dormibacteraeota bacterium]|nr:TonB-dependent receptor [Candidatus Dormibacteraeota bacterium]
MRTRLIFLLAITAFSALTALATVFGTVRGIAHDPQHRPIPGMTVLLEARTSQYTQTAQTDANGEFHFDAVPLGEYFVTISQPGFSTQRQSVTVLSGSAPILHFEMALASQNESVTVSDSSGPTQSKTPTSLVDRLQIQSTPGASRSNSLAMITNYVPGAYLTHDQLHIRGGHQVSWLIDGVPIPNTNIASNLGPQIDPKDIDAIETQRGSYSADFGDRTYGVFNVAPRTGFERNNEAELLLSAGNFYQTDDQLSLGSHTNRFAYYASVNANRTNLGLQTVTPAVVHDQAHGYGGFGSLIYNLSPSDQLRLVMQLRRDAYEVPFDPNDPNTLGQKLDDRNKESDAFTTFSWVHTFNKGLLATISPFYHFNRADYQGNPITNFPTSTTDDRSSRYAGGQATLSWVASRNNARAGLYGFAQRDEQIFGLIHLDDPKLTVPLASTNISGSLLAAYIDDELRVTSLLTVNAGLRQTHFSGSLVENSTSPRVGAALRIPKLNWVVRAFYGHFYQAPPLLTASGPILILLDSQNLHFIPLRGERDEESQFGLSIPWHGWTLDADNFHTRAINFFDHNCLASSAICFPVAIDRARIRGWELTLHSPRLKNRAQLYLTYSNQLAQYSGGIAGGLENPNTFCATYCFLDHDQRHTLHVGGSYDFPWHTSLSTDVYYASGFSNGDATIPGDHLQPHTTFDLSVSKQFGEKFSIAIHGINVANRRILLDNSAAFGGTHFLNPRELYAQVRYRFHY